jgi:hypothetical protein
MAVEVLIGQYLREPQEPVPSHPHLRLVVPPKPPTPFVPNYLHDVESVLWMALFSQTSTVPTDMHKELSKINEDVGKHSSKSSAFFLHTRIHHDIFNVYPANTREHVLGVDSTWYDYTSRLPSEYQAVISDLHWLRAVLRCQYDKVEKDIGPCEMRALGSFYESIIQGFQETAKVACEDVRSIDRTMNVAVVEGSRSEKRESDDLVKTLAQRS